MNFIPILFSTPMVQAILNDRKTMTRRTSGLEVINENPDDWQFEWMDYKLNKPWRFTQKSSVNEHSLANQSFNQEAIKCPYGAVGDVLWVRETFSSRLKYDQMRTEKGDKETDHRIEYFYKATTSEGMDHHFTWKPSIHMPKAACRIFLKITKIHVERLHNISGKDAVAEGVRSRLPDNGIAYYDFQALWIIINGADSWNANPWVWAIEFERVEKPVVFDCPLHSISHAISTVQDSYKVTVAALNHGFNNKRTTFFKRLLESRFFYFNETGECVYSIPYIERIDTDARMDLCPHDFYCWVTFMPDSNEVLMITRDTRTWSVVSKDSFYLGALSTLFRYYDARTSSIGPFQDLKFAGKSEFTHLEIGMQLKQDALNRMNDGEK